MYFILSEKAKTNKIEQKSYISIFAIVLLFTAMFHHFVLCFINTNIFHIGGAWLILIELALLGMIALFFARQPSLNYILIFLFIFTNAFVLTLFQQFFDPKEIRNFLVPVLLIWLGTQYDNKVPVDRIVIWAGFIVLIIGLFELLLPEMYQRFFNVQSFLISTGRLTESATQYSETSFALNGTRYGGRNLLNFLGDHRVSSVFLETVTVSNFATVLAAWGLSKNTIKEGWLIFTLGLIIAVLADSRFGVTIITLMVLLRFVLNKELLKLAAYFMPVVMILICIYFGSEFIDFHDDFKTRLGYTGYFLLNFKPLEFFGLSSVHYTKFLDQGYAKLFHFNGVILATVLWIVLCRFKVKENGEIFKYLIAIIISSNLAISGDSMFSFKWVSFMWFLLGSQSNKVLTRYAIR